MKQIKEFYNKEQIACIYRLLSVLITPLIGFIFWFLVEIYGTIKTNTDTLNEINSIHIERMHEIEKLYVQLDSNIKNHNHGIEIDD